MLAVAAAARPAASSDLVGRAIAAGETAPAAVPPYDWRAV